MSVPAALRTARGPVLVALLVLAGAVVLAVVAAGGRGGRLDPRSPTPEGSRAVAQVLGDLGVRVERRTTTATVARAAGPGSTVLVTEPDLLAESQVAAVRATGAHLVVLGGGDPGRFAPGVRAAEPSQPEVRQPGCRLGAARRAGAAAAGGFGYAVDAEAVTGRVQQCYAREGVPSLVRVRADGRTITFLGNPAALTNRAFGDDGNAALALGLLGQTAHLVWYQPSLADVPADAAQTSFYDLVPDGVRWGLVQLLVAAVLLALWRARRLGPVVAEPLPVVVRAAEATEGRARLYRRASARGTAAEALRSAVRTRLAGALGLPPGAPPAALVDAVAARSRHSPGEVGALLYGAEPADDHALVRLADELDALDREVRRP